MYSWAHSDAVVTEVQVPGKLPSLDWLLKSDNDSTDDKTEPKKGTFLLLYFLAIRNLVVILKECISVPSVR